MDGASCQWLLCILAALTVCDVQRVSASLPTLSDGNRTYPVKNEDGGVCLYASFEMTFYLYSLNQSSSADDPAHVIREPLPPADGQDVTINGVCDTNIYKLSVDWTSINQPNYNFNMTLSFDSYDTNGTWSLRQISLTFEEKLLDDPDQYGQNNLRTFSTADTFLFNRTFHSDQYFYCKGCKKYYFSSKEGGCNSTTHCSYIKMEKAVIFVGDLEKIHPSKRLCFEDWVSLRELIVPIAVGGALGALLLVVLTAYIIAFVRRKVIEKKGLEYRRLDH